MVFVERDEVIVKPSDIKPSSKYFEVLGVINPGVIRADDGKIVMYVRVIEKLIKTEDNDRYYVPRNSGINSWKITIDSFSKKDVLENNQLDIVFSDFTKRLKFISHLRRIVLDSTGFNVISIDDKPSFFGISGDGELGIEDSRITKIGSKYYMTYVALSRDENITTNCAVSLDLVNWKRTGVLFREQNKDVVLFPDKVGGKYVAFNRPEGNFEFSLPNIWISYSPDLEYWGDDRRIAISHEGSWDSGRIGAGAPPIKLGNNWLLLYHGVIEKKVESKNKLIRFFSKLFHIKEERLEYAAGCALFDRNMNIAAKSKSPILLPSNDYETGTFEHKKVVFPTGLVLDKTKDFILLYCGGGDVVTSVKKISLARLMEAVKS